MLAILSILTLAAASSGGLNYTGPVCTELIDSFNTLSVGDFVPLCIVVSNATYSFKTVFYPKVDEFTLLEVDNSWRSINDFWGNIDNLGGFKVHIELNGQRSDMLSVQANGFQVPYWTITNQLSDGVLNPNTPFVWDNDGGDGCFGGCPESECVNGFCGVSTASCDDETFDCDLKIYVGWYGTDLSGSYLTSASKRLSQFRTWSVVELFDSASSFAAETLPDPDDLIDQAGDLVQL